jgi:hypothetical protein
MTQAATTQAVMNVVLRSQGCDLEEILHDCLGLTWNQVFLEVDRLSREGDVVLNLQQPGRYSVKPCIRHS